MAIQLRRKGRIADNIERNRILYALWERGETIRNASLLTGIPEGTVAYFWRKYNRAAAAGKPIVIGSTLPRNEYSQISEASAVTAPQKPQENLGKPDKSQLDFIDKMMELCFPKPLGPERANPSKDELATSYLTKRFIENLVEKDADQKNLSISDRINIIYDMNKRGYFPTPEEAAAAMDQMLSYYDQLAKARGVANANAKPAPTSGLPQEKKSGTNFTTSDSRPESEDSAIKEFLAKARWTKVRLGVGDTLDESQVPENVSDFMIKNSKTSLVDLDNTMRRVGYDDDVYVYSFNKVGDLFRNRKSAIP